MNKKKRIELKPYSNAPQSVDSILLSPQNPVALLVFGHGAGAGMEHANMNHIAEAMASRGIATYRYNFPFIHRGGGRDSKQVTLDTIHSAVAQARKLISGVPVLAGGHSFGGRMTTVAHGETDLEVDGLVCSSFPLHATGRSSDDRIGHFANIKVPCLFLCGDRDTMMTFDLFEPAIRKMKAGRKSLATLHKIQAAGHGYKVAKRSRVSEECVFEEMARVTREWLGSTILKSPRKKK